VLRGGINVIPIKINWQGGKHFVAHNVDDVKIHFDARVRGGGSGDWANPLDHLIAAAGVCSGMDVVDILEKMRQPLDSLEIEMEGEQRDEYPRYFTSIKVRYIVRGKGLDRAKVERAVDLSQNKYCSVTSSLRPECKITAEVVVK
jgi:putative redox protein